MTSASARGGKMDTGTAIKLIDKLIQDISIEINNIKSQVASTIIMQVAVYSHDHIGADRLDFGRVSNSPSVNQEELPESSELEAVLLDREHRRNALKHLKHLVEESNTQAIQLVQQELAHFFSEDETYRFLLEPELEHPNEYIKPYPYT